MSNLSAAHLDLQAMARQVMLAHGFQPDYPSEVQQQLERLGAYSAGPSDPKGRDLRGLLWSSIDNDTSRDLDQIEFAEQLASGAVRVLIGIADVDAFVARQTAIDRHAERETTTVYTGVRNFSMLPEALSTGITSLLEGQERSAIVADFVVRADGNIESEDVYPAMVVNRAQLTYNAVGPWLEGSVAAPPKVSLSSDLQSQLKLQDEIAQTLRTQRHERGALDIETIEVRPVVTHQKVSDLVRDQRNRATDLIEDFMIAANGVVARKLLKVSSLRRIVRTPKRWDRMVALAAEKGEKLPDNPDSKALNELLQRRKAADPVHFPDLSLAVIKLMGPGEYVVERPGDPEMGHFGLAVQDYTHSTAPNRRFADLVTQRLLKAFIAGSPPPYSDSDLDAVAKRCTLMEDAARKVEREMTKRLSAIAMHDRIGQVFDAIVTGVNENGTFVRVLHPHVEGKLVRGFQGLDVGDSLKAKLINTDPERGYIDFARA
jgi:exoribonuclease-2